MLDQCFRHKYHSKKEQGMIHMCDISKKWIIFILLPMCVSLDRLKEGGKYLMWDNDLQMVIALFPLHDAKPENQLWYPYKPQTFIGHIASAFDVDGDIVCPDTLPLDKSNVFGGFFLNKDGQALPPGS